MSDRPSVTFAANGEYLVSGGTRGVQVRRVEDGKLLVTMEAEHVQSVALSKDGKRIAAGTSRGDVFVWDAKTYKQVFIHREVLFVIGSVVDLSPDSTRLVVTSKNCTAAIWDIKSRARRRTLDHGYYGVIGAKYSPQGDRIATASPNSVRVYDSSDGRALVDIKVKVTPWYNTGLVWFNDHLLVVSDNKIMQFDASTGSAVSEWPVPDTNNASCIALPQHGEFIACSTNRIVTIWDTSTRTQLGLIQHPQDIYSIALSPDNRFIAIGGEDEKITIKRLSRITEPDIQIDDVALDTWKQDQLANAEALLTTAISQNPSHHVLANRALVRARSQQWDGAITDAIESIAVQPSGMGYIAKSVSLVGTGKKLAGYRACDIAFEHFHSTHVSFLLLIKAVVVCMAGDHDDAISRVDDLIATLHLNSICYVVQAYMHLLHGNSRVESGNYEGAIRSFERARAQLRPHTSRALSMVSLISGWKFDDLDTTIHQRLCEALYAAGRADEACESLLNLVSSVDQEVCMSGPITAWVSDFLRRFLSTPQGSSDHVPPLLEEWAKLELTIGPWRDALAIAVNFLSSRFRIYQTICEQLDTLDKITDATECFHQMTSELGEEINLYDEQAQWVLGFKPRLSRKLEYLGDAAMDARRHDEAIAEYSAALSLDPTSPQGLLVKRSKAYVARGLWEDGLQDANKVIALDPSSPWGHERKHAALHRAGRYDDAIGTLEMLFQMSQSPDPVVREQRQEYVDPTLTKAAIHKAVKHAIRHSPPVLINTHSGRLLDKSKQASLFESLPVFKELISSMTTDIDHARIERKVAQYYRYATFSHTWEDNEPLFEDVIRIVVYDLEESFTHDKLQMFCKISREAGFHWAWSDTCCINKANQIVLQEALVAMFKWYEGSALTIVFLRGVHSPSKRGDLMRSIWNTRAWTFQEYHASKVVRFYTEDWTPYMDLDIPNHKDSPEIISEMEEATNLSVQALRVLRPGLEGIREKLCLASRRETTLVEDAAYSLLGIFSVSLPIVYGEGDQALGRLLAQVLTSSGDTRILAWTGNSGSFNSCLPVNITVFNQLLTSYIPQAITDAKMETIIAGLRASSLNLTLVTKFHDRLSELRVPSVAVKRMSLPCIVFKLGPLSISRSSSERVFRAQTTALGIVEIRTKEDLTHLDSLFLVHPWIDFLLNRQPVGTFETIPEETTDDQSSPTGELSSFPGPSNITPAAPQTQMARLVSHLLRPFDGWPATHPGNAESLRPPSSLSETDKQTRALQVIARLRQPFGALLLTPHPGHVAAYRRVAAESLITVQVEEIKPAILDKLAESVRVLDVL